MCPFCLNSTDHLNPSFSKCFFPEKRKEAYCQTLWTKFHYCDKYLSSQNSFLRLSQNTVTYNEKLQFRLNKMLIQNNVICYHIIIRLLHFQAWNSYCILNHCCVWNGLLIFGMLEALMIFCQKNLVVAGVSTQIWIVTLCRVRDYT